MEIETEDSGNEEKEMEFLALTEPKDLTIGDFVLTKFLGEKRNATTYRYICIIQNKLAHKEYEVMAKKSSNSEKKII